MCIGSALCCCLKLGTKLLVCIACSGIGILIIGGLIIYFVFFHNKSEKKTTVDDATTVAVKRIAQRMYNEHLKHHLFGDDMAKEKAVEDLGQLPD